MWTCTTKRYKEARATATDDNSIAHAELVNQTVNLDLFSSCDTVKNATASYPVANGATSSNKISLLSTNKNDVYWLLNILFSDCRYNDFKNIGDVLSRSDLDTRASGKDRISVFWETVHHDFVDYDKVDINELVSSDSVFANIDPGLFSLVQTPTLLKKMWHSLRSKFQRVYEKIHRSGNGDADFWKKCAGQKDVYYLYHHTVVRKDALNFVKQGFFPYNQLDSMMDDNSSCASMPAAKKARSDRMVLRQHCLGSVKPLILL